MNAMIQGPFCRAQIGDIFELKGKALTEKIRSEIKRGGLMRGHQHVDPVHSPKKTVAFWFTAKTGDLFDSAALAIDCADRK